MRNDIVVVTGAASGIGTAVTRRFREDGWTTVGIDRTPASEANRCIVCDLSDAASIDAAIAEFHDQISVLCNVAGSPGRHQVRDGGAVVNVASRAGSNWMNLLGPIKDFLATADSEAGLEWYEEHAPDMPAYDFSKAALIAQCRRP